MYGMVLIDSLIGCRCPTLDQWGTAKSFTRVIGHGDGGVKYSVVTGGRGRCGGQQASIKPGGQVPDDKLAAPPHRERLQQACDRQGGCARSCCHSGVEREAMAFV